MKLNKLIITILFLLLSFNIYAKELTVMSFNVQGHGPNSSEHRIGKDKWENQIISIIKKSGAQLVLLQEFPIKKNQNIQSFMNKLNKKKEEWKYETSIDYSLSKMDLNNAVIYNSKYLTLVNDLAKKEPLNMYDYKLNPENDNRMFKFIKNNEQVLEFSYINTSTNTFYVINVHLPGPDEKDKLFNEKTQLEQLYAYYKRDIPLIIAGDFNISRKELLRGSNFNDGIIDGNDSVYVDDWGQKTTVTKDKQLITLKSDYDHFIISNNSLFSISEQMHHVYSKSKKESYNKLKISRYKYTNAIDYHKGLSDHMPIMIKLKFND